MTGYFLNLIIVFIFGACIGSFLNVLILRLPEGKPANGRSHCPQCKHQLSAFDLVPIFSFLFLGGRCRYCKKKISNRYVFIETITAALFSLNYLFFTFSDGPSFLVFLRVCLITSILVVIFMIDFEHFLVLDRVLIPAVILVFISDIILDVAAHSRFFHSLSWYGVLSGAGLCLLFAAIHFGSRGRWLGLGDVKLAVLLGLVAPFPFIFINIILGTFIGSAVGLLFVAFGGKNFSMRLPFATFLAVSTLLTLYFGTAMFDWYVHLLKIATY